MKISDSSPGGPASLQFGGAGSVKGAATNPLLAPTGISASGSGDAVELSGISQLLQIGSAARTRQLQALASQVRSSQYSVPSSILSRSLIGETLSRSGSLA